MTSPASKILAILLPLAALCLLGCPADHGEVCFAHGDCSSGLVCCKTTASSTARGRCLGPDERCGVADRPDASVDASTDASTDGGTDASMDGTMSCDPTGADCGMGYCMVTACGATAGMCVDRPIRCDGLLAPVCGCDRQTYTSSCEAARSGMSVDHSGICIDSGAPVDAGSDAAADAGGDAAVDAGSDASADAG
ncbi:MAG: hypothetical protein JRH11_19155 [Deltaproteobacteria bacterium]|nr:hypothetical protein [Deltaproteobacteria bacterium]